jgi:Fe-S-cluster-containing dehydrogenase component
MEAVEPNKEGSNVVPKVVQGEVVPRIIIDETKCTGCHLCEIACAIHHTGTVNPERSRIRVFEEADGDIMFPQIAGPYTEAECNSKHYVVIAGQEYDACMFCRASCPAKPIFKEPDTGIPLKCDFCGDPPDPSCVKVCASGALTLEGQKKEEGEVEKE